MDDEMERELSTERKVNLIELYPYYCKDDLARHFNYIELINQTLNLRLPTVSGSCMEGAALVRNLNPNLKLPEKEIDIMLPVTKILRNRSKEVIVDLEYAKGYVWIKYEPGCFDSQDKLDRFLIKHKDGNTYLNSKTVRDTWKKGFSTEPDSYVFSRQMVEGPSSNLKLDFDPNSFPSEVTIIEEIKMLQECARIVENTSKALKKFHSAVLLKLKELEKIIQGNPVFMNITDVEELAAVVLPRKKERQNFLLKVHWMSLAFINESLSAILIIDKLLPKKDWHEKLGIARFLHQVNSTPSPISKMKEIFEGLDSYFKYLVYLMPKEVYEKCKMNPEDGLLHFLQNCPHSKQAEVKKLFHVLRECKSFLLLTSYFLELWGRRMAWAQADNKMTGLSLNFDMVPSIAVIDFPYIASEWVTRHRVWPSLLVIKRIVTLGCHIVPKPYNGEEGNNFLDWRWSFSFAEIILAHARTTRMDISYLLLKSIFYRYLKPIEHDNKTLASYLVKTVMLWQCEEFNETWWSSKTIVKCVSILLNRLKVSFFNKHLPHYFIRGINLFHDVADELVLYGQAVLESLCADPIACIEEVLQFYVFEDDLIKNETIAETGLKPILNFRPMLAPFPETFEEEKYIDQARQRITGDAMNVMNLFKTIFKELVSNLLPGTDNFSDENSIEDKELNLNDQMETIDPEFSDIFDIPLD